MADNTQVASGAGDTIRDKDRTGVKTQIVGLDINVTGSEVLAAGDANRGLYVGSHLHQVVVSQTPTCSTSPAYTSGDAIGGLLTFANAARFSGGTGRITCVTIMCKTAALLPVIELVLVNQTFTAVSDNAAFNPSDADMANRVGVIGIGNWADYGLNSIATWRGAQPFVLTGTSLFGQMVTRSAITLAGTTDLIIDITIEQD